MKTYNREENPLLRGGVAEGRGGLALPTSKEGISGRFVRFIVLLSLSLTLTACGYHIAGTQLNAGRGTTIAVPTFVNKTTTYKIEQQFTQAVREELIRRTHFSVESQQTGDLVLTGEVKTITFAPVIFNPDGSASSYAIAVDLKIDVTDTRTKKIVFHTDDWVFRDVFELAQTSAASVPEDPAAVDRLSRKFASSLVESILYAKPKP
jgi:LPS-assembly lipoprotein